MNKISYDERAKFYDKEVMIDPIKIKFFQKIKRELNLNKTLYFPCASGIYLDTFSTVFDKSYFADINYKMIEELSKKIFASKIDNVYASVLDLRDVNNVSENVDCIFVLDQAMQYIDYEDFEKFLINASLVTKYIVLDIFDFNKEGILSYFNSTISNNEFYKSKEFELEDKKVTRYNSHKVEKDKITFQYNYETSLKEKHSTSFILNNYSLESTLEIIKRTGKYKIANCFKDYNMNNYDNAGQFILILEKV